MVYPNYQMGWPIVRYAKTESIHQMGPDMGMHPITVIAPA
jgi:hypothetical protein